MLDAACGFGGYRESGYGREGGKEGMLEYLEPAWFRTPPRCQRRLQFRTTNPSPRLRQTQTPPLIQSIAPSSFTSEASKPAPIPAIAWKSAAPKANS